MKTVKMSLAKMLGKLSRYDMKNIMAGSGGGATCGSTCSLPADCAPDCCYDCGTTGPSVKKCQKC